MITFKAMETKEIIANNKLIAEFMDALTLDSNGNSKEDITKFKYHSSWGWLMPVVERIESLGFVTKIKTSPTISKKWTIHHMIVQKDSIKDIKYVEIKSEYAENESKVSLVYRGVIAFIKWYNENK